MKNKIKILIAAVVVSIACLAIGGMSLNNSSNHKRSAEMVETAGFQHLTEAEVDLLAKVKNSPSETRSMLIKFIDRRIEHWNEIMMESRDTIQKANMVRNNMIRNGEWGLGASMQYDKITKQAFLNGAEAIQEKKAFETQRKKLLEM